MHEPAFVGDADAPDTSTVALLHQRFNDVLIPLEDVRKAYFRNRSSDRFRRALREHLIPLPVVRLDDSQKGQGYICIYHLAALIEARALDALTDHGEGIAEYMRRAVPATQFRDVAAPRPGNRSAPPITTTKEGCTP